MLNNILWLPVQSKLFYYFSVINNFDDTTIFQKIIFTQKKYITNNSNRFFSKF